MKLAVIIKYNPFFEQGAAANRWQSLLLGLAAHNIQIDVFGPAGYLSPKEKEMKGNPGLPNVQVIYLTKMLFDSLNKLRFYEYVLKPLSMGLLKRTVLKHARRKNYDVIWIDHEARYYQLGLTLKKTFPAVKLFSELSEFLDIHQFNTGNVLQKKAGDLRQQLFETQFLPGLDGIAYMTRTLMEHYQAMAQPKPACIHLPMTVDLKRFEEYSAPPFSSPYIAFLGVMNNQKDGVDILIRAFSAIAADFPDLTLRLFGFEHPDVAGQRQLIKEFALEERVVYHGAIDRQQVVGVMKNARLLVLPRPDSHQAKGGFPTKLGEYLATGNPVCATRVGEIPDYLEDGVSVFFARPGSAEDFARAMREALSDPEKAEKVGQKGREVAVQQFNAQNQSEHLYQFLKELKHA